MEIASPFSLDELINIRWNSWTFFFRLKRLDRPKSLGRDFDVGQPPLAQTGRLLVISWMAKRANWFGQELQSMAIGLGLVSNFLHPKWRCVSNERVTFISNWFPSRSCAVHGRWSCDQLVIKNPFHLRPSSWVRRSRFPWQPRYSVAIWNGRQHFSFLVKLLLSSFNVISGRNAQQLARVHYGILNVNRFMPDAGYWINKVSSRWHNKQKVGRLQLQQCVVPVYWHRRANPSSGTSGISRRPFIIGVMTTSIRRFFNWLLLVLLAC